MPKSRVWSAVLALALFIGGTSAAISAPVAYLPLRESGELIGAIVLTNEVHEACPYDTEAAVVIDTSSNVKQGVLGCWIYAKDEHEVSIFWMNDENDETFVATIPADDFEIIKKQEAL